MSLKEELKKKSREISLSRHSLKEKLLTQRAELLDNIEKTREDVKVASAMGDRSENAAFSDAVQQLQNQQTMLITVETQLKANEAVNDDPDSYYPIDMIVLYSTFLLRDSFNEEFIFKMYPDGVSDIDQNILDRRSPLGELLWRKQKGDVVGLEHKDSGDVINYTVIEVY